jgi:uncharacterized protein (DUF58 family)
MVLIGAVGLVGSNELLALSGATATLLVYSTLWLWGRSASLEVQIEASPRRVTVGSKGTISVLIRNGERRRSPIMTIRRSVPALVAGGPRVPALTVPSLAPGHSRSSKVSLRWPKRGVYELGPALVEVSDPFGLMHKMRMASQQQRVVVLPLVRPLWALPAPFGPAAPDASELGLTGFEGDEFHAIRDYEPGDDLRKVHWAVTARTGSLMIREDHPSARARLTVLLDLRLGAKNESAFELACSIAASVAVAAVSEARSVRLVASDGIPTEFGHTQQHVDHLLDLLAKVESRAGGPLVDQPGELVDSYGDGSLVIVSAAPITSTDIATLALLTPPESVTLVAIDPVAGRRTTTPGTQPVGFRAPPLPFNVISIADEKSFARVWNSAFSPMNR